MTTTDESVDGEREMDTSALVPDTCRFVVRTFGMAGPRSRMRIQMHLIKPKATVRFGLACSRVSNKYHSDFAIF